ncbi:MAG: thiol:disulfide interchange protein DsbA/DsbL [Thiogranum sp.]|jgi:thiol:disulfide interchange protein DsbA
MKKLLALLALLLLAPPSFAAFKEGVEYQKLDSPQPTSTGDKIEVMELFWYGCPHCYHLEPELNDWLKHKPDDVVFVRVPAVLGPSWELLARAYYTADLLGVLDKIHEPLFDHIHKDRKMIRNAADLKAFFMEQGVSSADFDKTFNSFAVITKTNRSTEVRNLYGVTGVPTLVVNGKYRTTGTLAGGNEKMLQVVDFLIGKERAASSKQAHGTAQ